MRKWKVIILTTIAMVIAALVFAVTSLREEGDDGLNVWKRLCIRYYKWEFRAARDANKKWEPGLPEPTASLKRIESAQKRLVDLGYLAELRYITSNQPANVVALRFAKRHRAAFKRSEFRDLWGSGTNVVVVVCRPQDVPTWEGFLREADVP